MSAFSRPGANGRDSDPDLFLGVRMHPDPPKTMGNSLGNSVVDLHARHCVADLSSWVRALSSDWGKTGRRTRPRW